MHSLPPSFTLHRPALNAVVRIPGRAIPGKAEREPSSGTEAQPQPEQTAEAEPLYVFLDTMRVALHTFHCSFPSVRLFLAPRLTFAFDLHVMTVTDPREARYFLIILTSLILPLWMPVLIGSSEGTAALLSGSLGRYSQGPLLPTPTGLRLATVRRSYRFESFFFFFAFLCVCAS
jgi:hypothetical protein